MSGRALRVVPEEPDQVATVVSPKRRVPAPPRTRDISEEQRMVERAKARKSAATAARAELVLKPEMPAGFVAVHPSMVRGLAVVWDMGTSAVVWAREGALKPGTPDGDDER